MRIAWDEQGLAAISAARMFWTGVKEKAMKLNLVGMDPIEGHRTVQNLEGSFEGYGAAHYPGGKPPESPMVRVWDPCDREFCVNVGTGKNRGRVYYDPDQAEELQRVNIEFLFEAAVAALCGAPISP